MVKLKHHEINNNDIKSQLVIDIYNIYKNSYNSSCFHVNHNYSINNFNNNIKSPFIDWYLILSVGEDASIGTIRKQYHKLALLLHPDKNKHPKAEFSFKLISQAYKCLSDNAKRSSFNLERRRNQCFECNRTPHHPTVSSPHQTSRREGSSPSTRTKISRSEEIQNNLRALSEKLKEEARVVENCMRLNRASKDEYPVFNPSNYANQGYPHKRNQPFSCNRADVSWRLQKENVGFSYDQRRNRCEIPIFRLATDNRNMNINSACVGS